jgi:hypothetical protein
MRTFIIMVASLVLINCVRADAQEKDPVKWTYSIKKISKNEAFLIFDAQIYPRWHMYSQYFAEGGPVRMTFNFSTSNDYKIIGRVIESPKPKVEHDDIFEMDVQYFEGHATLSQRIKIISNKKVIVKGNFEYQVCFEDKCVLYNPDFEFEI